MESRWWWFPLHNIGPCRHLPHEARAGGGIRAGPSPPVGHLGGLEHGGGSVPQDGLDQEAGCSALLPTNTSWTCFQSGRLIEFAVAGESFVPLVKELVAHQVGPWTAHKGLC